MTDRSREDNREARSLFHDAMASIPQEDKGAYLEAVGRVPHLVEVESNPDRYLDFLGYDPWKAALRVAEYWKARVDLFGDRAFLPLTISGEGALAPEDVRVLETGSFMVLPNNKEGRAVVLHDRARLVTRESMDIRRRIRALFYVLSALSESEENRKNGFVMISPLGKNTRKSTLEMSATSRGISLIRSEVIPIRVVEGHLVVLEDRAIFNTFISLLMGVSEKLNILKGRVKVHNHATTASDALLKDLQQHGFDAEGIPTVPFGGLFSFGCFKSWIVDRRRVESNVYSSDISDVATYEIEEETRKKKRADAANCRRKRFRKKIELQVTQEEVKRLRQQNLRLREQESILVDCLQRANQVVESHLNNPRDQLSARSLSTRGVYDARSTLYRSRVTEVSPTALLSHLPIGLTSQISDSAAQNLIPSSSRSGGRLLEVFAQSVPGPLINPYNVEMLNRSHLSHQAAIPTAVLASQLLGSGMASTHDTPSAMYQERVDHPPLLRLHQERRDLTDLLLEHLYDSEGRPQRFS